MNGDQGSIEGNTLRPSFTPFSFNAPDQFTPLINLRPTIFGLTLFGGFISIYVFLFSFLTGILFLIYAFLIYAPLFQEIKLGRTQGPCCTWI